MYARVVAMLHVSCVVEGGRARAEGEGERPRCDVSAAVTVACRMQSRRAPAEVWICSVGVLWVVVDMRCCSNATAARWVGE